MHAASETYCAVSIVISTYKRVDMLIETVAAAGAQDFDGNTELIVVDDAADDETKRRLIRSGFSKVTYIPQEHRGVATARNRGAHAATGKYLLFLDDDILIPPDFIERGLEGLRRTGRDMLNPRWEFPPDFEEALRRHPFGRFRIATETWVKTAVTTTLLEHPFYEPSGVTACALLMERITFSKVGGFDESFPYAGCEDQEFSYRARQLGMRFVLDESLVVWHNDRRLSLEQFGARQERGAMTAVLLATKYPDTFLERALIQENVAVATVDAPQVKVKKRVKSLLVRPTLMRLFLSLTHALEELAPTSRILTRMYSIACGLYIFRGIREGARRYMLSE